MRQTTVHTPGDVVVTMAADGRATEYRVRPDGTLAAHPPRPTVLIALTSTSAQAWFEGKGEMPPVRVLLTGVGDVTATDAARAVDDLVPAECDVAYAADTWREGPNAEDILIALQAAGFDLGPEWPARVAGARHTRRVLREHLQFRREDASRRHLASSGEEGHDVALTRLVQIAELDYVLRQLGERQWAAHRG